MASTTERQSRDHSKQTLKNKQQNKQTKPQDCCYFGNWRSLTGEESWGTHRHGTRSAERLNRCVQQPWQKQKLSIVRALTKIKGTFKGRLLWSVAEGEAHRAWLGSFPAPLPVGSLPPGAGKHTQRPLQAVPQATFHLTSPVSLVHRSWNQAQGSLLA